MWEINGFFLFSPNLPSRNEVVMGVEPVLVAESDHWAHGDGAQAGADVLLKSLNLNLNFNNFIFKGDWVKSPVFRTWPSTSSAGRARGRRSRRTGSGTCCPTPWKDF